MKKIVNILLLIYCLLSLEIKSQEKISIEGVILSAKDNTPVIGASVRIEGSGLGSISRSNGSFSITNVQKGAYILLVSSIGFKPAKINIKVSGNYDEEIRNLQVYLEENYLQTSEVVISANKKLQAVQDVPISVSIIDNKSILDKNIFLVDEALKYVPGVQINDENISIRGSSGFSLGLGSRVSFLIDGFPMLSGDNGDIKFDIFPAPEIERIEIIKGAGSALYGTGAIGGVVNVISKEPAVKPAVNFRLFSGFYTLPNYEQWRYRNTLPFKNGAALSYSQSFGKFSTLLSGQVIRDEGFRYYDNYLRWNFLGKFKVEISDLTKINFLTSFSENRTTDWVYWNSLDSATRPPTETDTDIKLNSGKLVLAADINHIMSSNFFGVMKVGFLRTDFANTLPEDDSEYRQSTADAFNSEIQFNNSLSQFIGLTYGMNYNYNNVSSSTYGNHNQSISAIYAQFEVTSIPRLITTAGMRLDYEKTEGSDASTMISPKLGLNYELYESLRLRFSGGGGFRAPNVAEKYASVNFQGFKVVPNPELKPEKSWSAEFGMNYKLPMKKSDLNFDISAFYNYMDNLIEPTFDVSLPDAPIRFQNITKARIIGAELTIKANILNLINLQSAITIMDPEDLTLNETLKYRSNILWYSNMSLPIGSFELQFDYRYLSKVQNIDNTLGLEIKDYDARVPIHILDARILFSLLDILNIPMRIGINAENILNYYYTNVPGNLGPTRHLSLQLEGSF